MAGVVMRNGEMCIAMARVRAFRLITTGRSGYKPALKEVDVADILTKFLAYLAQHENGGLPIKIFWLTDYHLGSARFSRRPPITRRPKYVQALRDLAEHGARRALASSSPASSILHFAEARVREYLSQLDYRLSPLGVFAVEALARMLFSGREFYRTNFKDRF